MKDRSEILGKGIIWIEWGKSGYLAVHAGSKYEHVCVMLRLIGFHAMLTEGQVCIVCIDVCLHCIPIPPSPAMISLL